MKWAFIDYENVGNLNKVNLSRYDKIILFVGVKQNYVGFGTDIYTGPIEITYIRIAECKKNNLDFHLTYYLGYYDSIASSNIEFEVISDDTGYTPLTEHINLNGRKCIQITGNNLVQNLTNKQQKKPSRIVSNIVQLPMKARPKKLPALCNHIRTIMRVDKKNELEVQRYIKELIDEGVLHLDNDLVRYIS